MPKVADIKKKLPALAKNIIGIDGVSSVLVLGSYVDNKDKPDYILRDVDILAVVDIPSEDLLSIITGENDNNVFKMSKTDLENDGYNPIAVSFTKKFTSICSDNIDHWALCSDNNILHYGPIHDDLIEWQENKDKAEKHANMKTGINRKKLAKARQALKDDWYQRFKERFNLSLTSCPCGWYKSSLLKSDIIEKTIKLA